MDCTLRLLAEKPASEVLEHPLKSVVRLVELGYAEYTPYVDVKANGKWWKQRQVLITDKGREYLKELQSKRK